MHSLAQPDSDWLQCVGIRKLHSIYLQTFAIMSESDCSQSESGNLCNNLASWSSQQLPFPEFDKDQWSRYNNKSGNH